MMAKVLKRDVAEAEKYWGQMLFRWGEDNAVTWRARFRWEQLRDQWQDQTGKTYTNLKGR